ncbi:MAG TPA: ADP-ribosylglycohydrolase family protein [Armatimonadota bacterium]|nr:ADP-ribosylglycohydrolase family protein [Armatimonadota bacterium]
MVRGRGLGDAPAGGEDVPWTYTDDTNTALSIVDCLRRHGRIDPDWLAGDFAGRCDPRRGYGPAMHDYLQRIRMGADWRTEAPALAHGQRTRCS